jgi:hypothetical protein
MIPPDPAQLRPFPARPAFESLFVQAFGSLPGAHAALDDVSRTIAPIADADLDTPFGVSVVPAVAGIDAIGTAADASDHAAIASAADAASTDLNQQLGTLPAPSDLVPDGGFGAPIEPEPDPNAPPQAPPPTAPIPGGPSVPTPGGGGTVPDYATAVQIVTVAYETILERPPDPDGLAEWVRELVTGTITVAQLFAKFYASDEYLAKHPATA